MAMDVPAVLGSDTAKRILEDNGAFEYQGYAENMEKLQNAVQNADDTLWNGSLYAGWLQTLCPLLEERDERGMAEEESGKLLRKLYRVKARYRSVFKTDACRNGWRYGRDG